LLHILFILGPASYQFELTKKCNNLRQKYTLTDKVTINQWF